MYNISDTVCPRYKIPDASAKELVDEFLDTVPIMVRFPRQVYDEITRKCARHWTEMGFRGEDRQRMQYLTMHRLRQRRLRMQLED